MFFTIFVKRPAFTVEFKLEPQTTMAVFSDSTIFCSKFSDIKVLEELFFIIIN